MKNQFYFALLLISVLWSCSGKDNTDHDNMNYGKANPAMKDVAPVNSPNQILDSSKMDAKKKAMVSTGSSTSLPVDTQKAFRPQPVTAIKKEVPPAAPVVHDQPTVNQVARIRKEPKATEVKAKASEDPEGLFDPGMEKSFKGDRGEDTKKNSHRAGSSALEPGEPGQTRAKISAAKVKAGSAVICVLQEALPIEGVTLPAGTKLAAILNIEQGRGLLKFNTVLFNGKVYKVNVQAYDTKDGLEGLDIGDQTIQEGKSSGVKDAVRSTANSVASLLPGIGGLATQRVTSGVTNGISNRNFMYTIPASTVILQTVKGIF